MVLLKKYSEEGLFFTPTMPPKKDRLFLRIVVFVCLFFWPGLEQQIIIKGNAEKIAENLSDSYFESRPRGSKLGAWASSQSSVVTSRDELDETLKTYQQKFEGKEIPRPPHWGGFIVHPFSVEFWQGRPNRMHDRTRYALLDDFSWKLERLAP